MRKVLTVGIGAVIFLCLVFGMVGLYEWRVYAEGIPEETQQGGITPGDLIGNDNSTRSIDSSVFAGSEMKPYEDDYWDYIIEKLDMNYYEEIVDIVSEEMDFYNYDMAVEVLNSSDFRVFIKMTKDGKLINSKNVEDVILTGNNAAHGTNHLNLMQISGLDMNDYDNIIKKIEGSIILSYQLIKINDENSEETFSVLLETTDYCIAEGDTLSEIAQRKLTTVEKLMELNPQITDPDLIYPYTLINIR